jgi:hypothetical protein
LIFIGSLPLCENCELTNVFGGKLIDFEANTKMLCVPCGFAQLGLPPLAAINMDRVRSTSSPSLLVDPSTSSTSSAAAAAVTTRPTGATYDVTPPMLGGVPLPGDSSVPGDMRDNADLIGHLQLDWSRDEVERRLNGMAPGSFFLRTRETRANADRNELQFVISYVDRKTSKVGHSIVSYHAHNRRYTMEGNPTGHSFFRGARTCCFYFTR